MARLVTAHGAFGGAWCWERGLPGLEQAGHSVATHDLPGAGATHPPVAELTQDAYARRMCDVLGAGPPAVLVGHSMGGMIVTQAAARMPAQLTALVYLCAFVPEDGESLLALTARPEAADDQIQANAVLSGDPPVIELSAEATRNAIYNTATDEDFEWAMQHRRPQPAVPMSNPLELEADNAEAFNALPRRYITCLQDRSIPPGMQRFMFTRADCEPVLEIESDHAPYLSHVAETVSALDELARL